MSKPLEIIISEGFTKFIRRMARQGVCDGLNAD